MKKIHAPIVLNRRLYRRGCTLHRLITAFIVLAWLSPKLAVAQWLPASVPPSVEIVNCLSNNGSVIYAGYGSIASGPGGILMSTDDGVTWGDLDSGAIASSVFTIASQGSTIYAGTGAVFYTVGTSDTMSMYRSLDGGKIWKKLSLKNGYRNLISIALHGSNLYASTAKGLLLSRDSGIQWNVLSDSLLYPIVFLGSKMFAGSRFQGIVESYDSGMTWTFTSPSKDTGSNQIVVVGSKIVAVIGSSNVTNIDQSQFIVFSSDSGRSWTKSLIPAPVDQSIIAVAFDGKNIFGVSGTSVGTSWYSKDLGKTWASMTNRPDGINSPNLASSLMVAGNNLVAGTQQQGIGYYPLSALSVPTPSLPSSSLIVYPNPASTFADLQFDALQEPTFFEIFDALGRSVFRQHLSGGQATLHMDISELPAGIYYARFTAGGTVFTEKIIKE